MGQEGQAVAQAQPQAYAQAQAQVQAQAQAQAQAGDVEAMVALAESQLASGLTEPALSWLTRAAERGSQRATILLAAQHDQQWQVAQAQAQAQAQADAERRGAKQRWWGEFLRGAISGLPAAKPPAQKCIATPLGREDYEIRCR